MDSPKLVCNHTTNLHSFAITNFTDNFEFAGRLFAKRWDPDYSWEHSAHFPRIGGGFKGGN